jgi:GNAT superfamily N-acetyltransferase
MAVVDTTKLTVVPANEASCHDLQAVFGIRGTAAICQCQRFKLQPKEAFRSFPVEERAFRLRVQTQCGDPTADSTSGLVAYLEGKPVGWCAVEPRPAYIGLVRVFRVPWVGRHEDKADTSVWAVPCIFTRTGYRHQGIGYALTRATVEFARSRGARALEGYPMVTEPGEHIIWDEPHVGTQRMFAAAGFTEVSRPSPRRVVMRIDYRW